MTYDTLIKPIIQKRLDEDADNGLFLVPGPTGTGKTHAFIHENGVIPFLLENKMPGCLLRHPLGDSR